MPFSRPSLTTIIDRISSDFTSRVEKATTFLRRSFFKIASIVYGGAVYLLYEYINYVKDQLFIQSSDVEHLERHASEYGLTRDSGTKASGSVAITGTVGTTIAAYTELTTDNGLVYKTTALATIGAGGSVTVAIEAEKVGSDYNQDAGTVLSFVSPVANVDSTATVDSSGLTLGDDVESDSDFRARVLRRKRFPPHGGIAEDYETWALEVSGVTRAWSIPEYNGIGTIGLAFVQDGETDIFPSATERETVRDYIVSHTDPFIGKTVGIPVTAEPGFFVIALQPLTVNFDIGIYPNTSEIQASVTEKLGELFLQDSGPGVNLSISQMYESIMSAPNIIRARIDTPTDDVTAGTSQLQVIGDITYSDY